MENTDKISMASAMDMNYVKPKRKYFSFLKDKDTLKEYDFCIGMEVHFVYGIMTISWQFYKTDYMFIIHLDYKKKKK